MKFFFQLILLLIFSFLLKAEKLSDDYCIGYLEEVYWALDTIEEEESRITIASFFNETNLEFTESQIFNLPKNGYDDISVFARNFSQSANYPPQVLSINSQTFSLEGIIINENFSASIKSLVILDASNTVKIASRTFNF